MNPGVRIFKKALASVGEEPTNSASRMNHGHDLVRDYVGFATANETAVAPKETVLQKPVGFIDTHCHIDFLFNKLNFQKPFIKFRKINSETFPSQYEGCITVFCNPESFAQQSMWDSVLRERAVWAAFGCHPHMAYNYNEETESALVKALEHPKVVALGEIGLDYSKKNFCSVGKQKMAFRRQIRLALERQLPLVIHCREAHDDCIEIMKKFVPRDHKIHLHCFTEKWNCANQWLQEFSNLCIGITNVVSYPSARDIRETVRRLPLHKILLETDAPYFVPKIMKERFTHSHPGMAIHVAEEISKLKNIPLREVLSTCRENTKMLYGV